MVRYEVFYVTLDENFNILEEVKAYTLKTEFIFIHTDYSSYLN
jgi:hypothetical protein